MTGKVEKCPICELAADITLTYDADTLEGGYRGRCDRCGAVRVMQEVVNRFRQTKTQYLLSAFFRRYPAKVPPLVTQENVDELIAGMPVMRTVPEKLNGLLKLLVDSRIPPGTAIPFSASTSYPLVFAANEMELNFLLSQLSLRGLVTQDGWGVQVTASGFEKMEELEAASYKSSRNAFVAMWFDKSLDSIYSDAIEPAIRDAGYQPIRIDKTEHINRIDDEIISQLRQSRFLVADFTGQRPGVYYEAGYMHGLGRNVFWMIAKKQLQEVHFDVRQYNFIDYESSDEARLRLYNRIMANEGRGPGPIGAT